MPQSSRLPLLYTVCSYSKVNLFPYFVGSKWVVQVSLPRSALAFMIVDLLVFPVDVC